MQQNIKGLLCSLLYQLLETGDALIETIAPVIDDGVRKDTYTDWDILELKNVCFLALQLFGRPLCLFIDGLDEVDPKDGILELFEVVNAIKQFPTTKLCLSSRPEPPIVKRLAAYPQLQIHDSTWKDLWTYTQGKLQFPTSYLSHQSASIWLEIIDYLVRKSEGVFLWLCLAVKNLSAGLDNDDVLETVLHRAERLPPDLTHLYMDMWARLNEDHAIYRQSAALCFKLVIASVRTTPGPVNVPRLHTIPLTVLEMAIAADTPGSSPDALLLSAEEWARAWNRAHTASTNIMHLVWTRCAGLLDIVSSPPSPGICKDLLAPFPGSEFGKVKAFGDGSLTIRFIHRTAFDFLRDTTEGRTILSTDATSEQALSLRLFRGALWTEYLIRPSTGSFETFMQELSHIWYWGGSCPDSTLVAQFENTARLLEHLGTSGVLELQRYRRQSCLFPRGDETLIYAARFGLSRYVMTALAERNTSRQLKSDILLAVSSQVALEYEDDPTQYRLDLIDELLRRGADPNHEDCVLTIPTTTFEIFSPFRELLSHVPTMNFESVPEMTIQRLCHVIDGFLKHGADMSDLVTIYFHIFGPGRVGFTPRSFSKSLLFHEFGGGYEQKEGEVEKEKNGACAFLVPAFILLDVLIHNLGELRREAILPQDKCCHLDHITNIRAKAKSLDTAQKPRVIALFVKSRGHRSVSGEDSTYLSDAIIALLMNPRAPTACANLVARYWKVWMRSETKDTPVLKYLEDEGLAWKFSDHYHGRQEECHGLDDENVYPARTVAEKYLYTH